MPFVCDRSIVEGWEDGVYGRRYLRGPHGEDNEIQLLSLTAEGHEELDSEEDDVLLHVNFN